MATLFLRTRMFVFLFSCLFSVPLFSTQLVEGDGGENAANTFSTDITACISSPDGSTLYVATGKSDQQPKEFAVSALLKNSPKFIPLAYEKLYVNNDPDQLNPIYNTPIMHMGLLSAVERQMTTSTRNDYPVVVTANDPTSVHMIDLFHATSKRSVLSAKHLKDASGISTTSGIVGLGNLSNLYAVAAVKGHNQKHFGQGDSGLAIMQVRMVEEEEGDRKINKRIFEQVNAGEVEGPAVALPVNYQRATVAIGKSLASMGDKVHFCWDETLRRLYVGVNVKSGPDAANGARSIFMLWQTHEGKFVAQGLVPDAAFDTDHNAIVGALGANKEVTVHALRTLYTTTNLSYLLVHGGVGSSQQTKRCVYALPLAYNPQEPAHGMVACKDEKFINNRSGFNTCATAPEHMPTVADKAVQVGGGPLQAGDITDLFVRGDSVFATVADKNGMSGIFASQALFAIDGRITGWSRWQRCLPTQDAICAATLDGFGNFIWAVQDNGCCNTVKRSAWQTPAPKEAQNKDQTRHVKNDVVELINKEFPIEEHGVHGLFDFQWDPTSAQPDSLLVVTGKGKVALVNTYAGQIEQPTLDNADLLVLKSSLLQDLGVITCAQVSQDQESSQQWLFIAGPAGLAVLCDAQGRPSAYPLHKSLGLISENLAFKKIGNYNRVRKLLYDQGYLYVLTDKKLDRIACNEENFNRSTIHATTVADISQFPGATQYSTLIDALVSDKLALLATSTGFFRVGNGQDISLACDAKEVNWTAIQVPESVGPVTQIVALSSTMRSQDIARSGGNLFVLNAYKGKSRAQVVRYAIKDLSLSEIDDTTVLPFYNYIIADVQAPYVNFNDYRDLIATDGAALLSVVNKNGNRSLELWVNFGLRRGNYMGQASNVKIPLEFMSCNKIVSIVKSSAWGSWLIAGDFGLRVNQ